MAKAKKLPSGNWRVQAYIGKDADGKNKYKSFTASTKKEAEFMASEYLVQHKAEENSPNAFLTFSDASTAYFKLKENILSPSTLKGYKSTLQGLSNIINCTLQELSETDVLQRMVNTNATHYSVKSLKNQIGLVSAVLTSNKLRIPEITFPAAVKKEMILPDKSECIKIVAALKDAPINVECQILLALTCSLRYSEIAALTPAKIKDGYVYVSGAIVLNENNVPTYKAANKTKSSARAVPLPDYLDKRLKEICKDKNENEFIFPYSEQKLLCAFRRCLKDHGLPPYTIHAMRHAYASWMTSQGIPESTILKNGGWETDSVMKKVYRYAFVEDDKKAKSAADNFFK